MLKKIILISLFTCQLVIAEELTFSERIQASFIIGVSDGISGIANIITNPKKIIENVKQVKEEKKEAQLNFYKKLYEARGKTILQLNKERKERIQKYNKLRTENIKLKAIIKNYNMNKSKNYNKVKKEENLRKKALQKMKEDLKSK